MATIRRYGPRMVTPGVSPRPELGQGAEGMAAVFRQGFDSLNEFIRPAVEQVQTARGEQEALRDLGPERPEGGLVGLRRGTGTQAEGVASAGGTGGESDLTEYNGRTFEMRLPFTVRDAAYNATAERVITARTDALFSELMDRATREATSMDDLNARLSAVRGEVFDQIPPTLAGLRTSVQLAWESGAESARRQRVAAAAAAAARVVRQARDDQMTAADAETERLIAGGADADKLAEHLGTVTERLAQFGPREGFTIAGQEFAPDPSRAGIMTPERIADEMASRQDSAIRLMVEADFLRTDTPGAYVQQFEQLVFSGQSPFPLDDSLDMLRTMRGQAYTRESRRESAAQEALSVLDRMVDESVAGFVDMTEAGVPVTMPQEERAAILERLAPYPERRREAMTQFAVMDAVAQTHGMNAADLRRYIARERDLLSKSIERGEANLGAVAVIQTLQDRLEGMADSVTAESIGLPAIESQIERGRDLPNVDYDGLRVEAAGDADLLERIAIVEATHRDAEAMMAEGLSAQQREDMLENLRSQIVGLTTQAGQYGASAVASLEVLDGLERFSDAMQDMAQNDPTEFAARVGIELPGFEGVATMADAAEVVVARARALGPRAAGEGVENVVPLNPAEVAMLSETFRGANRGERVAFVAGIARLPRDHAAAIFETLGSDEPALFAAGDVYLRGNREAARVILRGATDATVGGLGSTDVQSARTAVMSGLLSADMIAPGDIENIDRAAIAYARGAALAEGVSEATSDHLQTGYRVALGEQADGTGGVVSTRFGTTIAPPGWDSRRVTRAIRAIDDETLTRLAGGVVIDGVNRLVSARDLVRSIEDLRPTDDPFVFLPLDGEGGFFITDNGSERGMLTIDLRDLN
jgi:hypothetical protein